MTNQTKNYSTSILVNQPADKVFAAITKVNEWWSKDIKGASSKLDDEFTFEVKDVHYSKQKLIEVVPNKKIVWQVIDSNMTFIKKHDEWTGTKIIFEIEKEGEKTRLTFTHEGLLPDGECYGACSPAWTQYIQHSLYQLITTGKGDPNLEGRRIEEISK